MRRKYLALLWNEARRGRALRWGLRALGIVASARFRRALVGPVSAEIMITWRCNARCEMCDYPSRAVSDELSLEEIRRLVDELSDLGAAGVSLCGGEPFLRSDLFAIVRHAKGRGLMVQIPTNGLLLDSSAAERLVDSGVDVVTISLDSHRPETCAVIRGVPGIYDRVIAAVEGLVGRARQSRRGPKVILSTTITRRTIDDVMPLLDLAGGLGVDGVSLLPVQGVETIHNRFNPEDGPRLEELFRRLIERKRNGDRLIDNSEGFFRMMLDRMEGKAPRQRCYAPYSDLHIGPRGEVFPCIYFAGMNRSWGNARRSSLREIWFSRDYQDRRQSLRECRACSIPCHWEMNLIFDRLVLPRFL